MFVDHRIITKNKKNGFATSMFNSIFAIQKIKKKIYLGKIKQKI